MRLEFLGGLDRQLDRQKDRQLDRQTQTFEEWRRRQVEREIEEGAFGNLRLKFLSG